MPKAPSTSEAKSQKGSTKNQLALLDLDPWLAPYAPVLEKWHQHYESLRDRLTEQHGSVYEFASGHHYLGFNYDKEQKGWWYREWAPQAEALHLIGEFNEWDRNSHSLQKLNSGVWEIFLPDKQYRKSLTHGSLLKVLVKSKMGSIERIPAYITRVVQDEETKDFTAQFWNPSKPYKWKHKALSPTQEAPFIYEAHVGMAQEREGLGTYTEFADDILPRIKALGYNAIQLMAIQEHPYYGSFGYHVSNFFAPSSRFGTPEELKYLIDKAHEMGIAVIMDIVHSHAVKNILEGLNLFDGTDYQYFHGGGKGDHPGWDSKVFNYGKWEVIQFLLSNVRYWLEEYRFDGFRFDGVTSMLYHHHGNTSFSGYEDYFSPATDLDAVTYLKLANALIHEINPHALSVAEDVSGLPGLSRKPEEGGVGFDFRLGMGLPDYWIKLIKEKQDEQWNVWEMWHVMTNRRANEKTVAYAESHDQALVGDKTIAFRLMDKEMYWHMNNEDPNIVIERGIALHKMIRLLTASLGGEGYLNFMGNEFGHPEWIDFPREGNGWSYQHARRQWSLADNGFLKYQKLHSFDKAMVQLLRTEKVLEADEAKWLNMDEQNQIMIFHRGSLIFIFNFHHSRAIPNYKFHAEGMPEGEYELLLNSDAAEFGGHDRIDSAVTYPIDPVDNSFLMYITNRTALVLKHKG